MNEPSRSDQAAHDVDDVVGPTGRFRLYLGSAAGVGKTCAMLDEGERRRDRGTDVVIGFVETHGRAKTIEMIGSLEIVPRRVVQYRGTTFEEMDVDAILERHPDVALIDELAHTNVPEPERHEKRWEDIFQLLDAGIAVISTLNIQHVESIADAVERFTDTSVRERVPDWVVRRADQVELIDSSPEQLRRRMIHGNIYPTAKIADALAGFFQTKNLTALRELALRYLADEADEDLLGYLREQVTSQVWDTAERVLVLAMNAGDDGVVHRAARIAARLKTTLEVALVSVGERTPRDAASHDQLRRVAESLGATVTEIVVEDLASSVVALAVSHQITQLVLPAPTTSMLGGLRRSSPIVRLLPAAAAAGIDVHLIASAGPSEPDQ